MHRAYALPCYPSCMSAGPTITAVFACAVMLACNQTTSEIGRAPGSVNTAPAQTSAVTAATPAALRLGRAIEANATTARLADIAKEPRKFENATIATSGTVTAICQHRGCWMEIKDDASEAHIRMAGHAFMIPRTAAGKQAKVLAQVQLSQEEPACDEGGEGMMSTASGPAPANGAAKREKKGCRAEAEEQMGHPLPKLELVALGVEIYG